MVVFAILAAKPNDLFYSFLPYLFLGMPIFNVFYVFTKRAKSGKSFFSADRNHFHDDLQNVFKFAPKSVLIIYSAQLIFALAGLAFLTNLFGVL
jgi:UDP-N-acetylmuramyl pentapeptide phosphotransferase/UDP-N-acetylglucosamine-1-phosphate transferase